MREQQQAQEMIVQMTSTWHDGIDLEFCGVNMGDAIAYDVNRVLGRVYLSHIRERTNGNGRSGTAKQDDATG
jgi:hypothetical protein